MAENIVGGLFGIMPEDIAAQRMAALDQQAQAFARMSSDEAYKTLGYKAGNLVGQGLFGVNDPQMERARQRQQMSQGIDFNDPESLLQAAQRANQMGDSPAAQDLYSKAVSLRKAQADLAKTQAETQKALREQAGSDPLQQLIRTGKYTPESVSAYAQSRNPADLVAIDKLTKPTADFIAKAMEFGFGDKPSYGGYTAEQVGRVNAALLAEGIKQKAAGASKTVLPAGESEFVKKLAELDAKEVSDARATRNNAISTLTSLQELSRLDDTGLISGTFAAGRVGATNLLNTLGLASPKDQEKLAKSENYTKEAGSVVLGILGGKLGAGFSNEDRKFILGLVPQLENSPAARREIIDFMVKKNQFIVDETTRLEDYARTNSNLKGFKPKIPLVSTPVRNKYSDLNDAELDARIKALQPSK
jgi:hypothetical protein